MNIFKIGYVAVIFVSLIFSAMTKADDLVVRCDGCNDTQKKNSAHSWAMQNMTNQERNSFSPNTKIINVIDLKLDTLISFSVKTTRMPSSPVFPWPRWSQSSVLISPSSTIKSKFDGVIIEKKKFTFNVDSIVIPTSVIGDPWEFVGCSYCEGVVQDYIRNQTAADVESFMLSIEAVALSFGLTSEPLPNTFELSLEGGGKIIIETSIGVGQPPPVFIKVLKILDASSNEVPLNAELLNNKAIYVIDLDAAETINYYINPFNFEVGERVGRVTVEECEWSADTGECL